MRQPVPHADMRKLDVLVGEWEMWALGRRVGPLRSVFDWQENGAFLVQRTDVTPESAMPEEWDGHAPFPTVTTTGYDDSAGEFTTLYADGRGVARVYGTSMTDGVWRQWRAAPGFHQRFTGTLEEAGDTITGGWEWSSDGSEWQWDFDMTYKRVG